jgi:hypothetical protein
VCSALKQKSITRAECDWNVAALGGQLLRCEVCDSGNHNTQKPSQVFLRIKILDEGGTGYYGVPAESKSKGFFK